MWQNFAFALKYSKEVTGSYETVARLRWTGKGCFLLFSCMKSIASHYKHTTGFYRIELQLTMISTDDY